VSALLSPFALIMMEKKAKMEMGDMEKGDMGKRAKMERRDEAKGANT
jgi:hypothetical protein